MFVLTFHQLYSKGNKFICCDAIIRQSTNQRLKSSTYPFPHECGSFICIAFTKAKDSHLPPPAYHTPSPSTNLRYKIVKFVWSVVVIIYFYFTKRNQWNYIFLFQKCNQWNYIFLFQKCNQWNYIFLFQKVQPVKLAAGNTLLSFIKHNHNIDERNEMCLKLETGKVLLIVSLFAQFTLLIGWLVKHGGGRGGYFRVDTLKIPLNGNNQNVPGHFWGYFGKQEEILHRLVSISSDHYFGSYGYLNTSKRKEDLRKLVIATLLTLNYFIFFVLVLELAHSTSKASRILYLELCHHVAELFSKNFFKENFYNAAMELASVSIFMLLLFLVWFIF